MRSQSSIDHQLDQRVRGLLVCPLTKQDLLPASEQQSADLKARAEVTALGTQQTLRFLVTRNQRWAYPVVEGVPWLLERYRFRLRAEE